MISYVTRSDPVTGARTVNVTRAIDVVRTCLLAAVIVTVCLARPAPGFATARGLGIVVTLGLSTLGWIVWMLAGQKASRMSVGSLIVMGAAGGVLAGLSPNSPALAVGCAATFSAGVRLKPEVSLGITAEAVAGFLSHIRSITEQLKSGERWRLILLAVVRAFPLAPAVEGPPLGFKTT